MEERAEYTVNAPGQKEKLIRYPLELHQWLEAEAKKRRQSVNSLIIISMEALRHSVEILEND